jgi:hypothetical protein
VLDPKLVGRVAAALKTNESFIEKDWHVVRALGVIAAVAEDGVHPAFSGGTSLAKGWGLIRRFSEDIDFKVSVPGGNRSAIRKKIGVYRARILEAMAAAGFILDGEPLVGNGSLFFRAQFDYDGTFPVAGSLRPGLRIEMTFVPPVRAPTVRPLQSLLAQAQRQAPEVARFPCVDPIETAADKLSALAWRTHVRDRSGKGDDATIVRHIHDLAALADLAEPEAVFVEMARRSLTEDAKRTKDAALDGRELVRRMLPAIIGDRLWRDEYERFVAQASYAPEDEAISFDRGIAACGRLVECVLRNAW